MATKTSFTEYSVLSANVYKDAIEDYNNFYLFIGKSSPWTDENNPPDIYDSKEDQIKVWKDMIAVKKITPADIKTGFIRINWESGFKYDEYRHNYTPLNPSTATGATRLRDALYYVVNSSNQVFICITNNNDSPSTVMPYVVSELTTEIFTTADGYRWKYLFTLDYSSLEKFNSPQFYPYVEPNLAVQAAAKAGAIHHVRVVTGGGGYTPSTTIPVFVDGDGIMNNSTYGAVTAIGVGGTLATLSVVSGGMMHYPSTFVAVNIRQVSASGVNKSAYGIAQTNSGGEITTVTVVIPGSGYEIGIPLSIVASTCVPLAMTDINGVVRQVIVYNGLEGFNFSKAEAVVVGVGTGCSLDPIISPIGGFGFDQEQDVQAYNVLVNVKLFFSDPKFPTSNDFRRFGVVTGLQYYDVGTSSIQPFTSSIGDANPKLAVITTNESVRQFSPDDKLFGQSTGAQATLIEVTRDGLGVPTLLRHFKDQDDNYTQFQVGETVISSSGATGVIAAVVPADFLTGIGYFLFVENRKPVQRNTEQSETITVAVEL